MVRPYGDGRRLPTTAIAAAGGVLMFLFVPDGPHLGRGAAFDPKALAVIFRSRAFRASCFGYFGHMDHSKVERFTHTFAIYEADSLPERYRGRLFGVEPLQGRVVLAEALHQLVDPDVPPSVSSQKIHELRPQDLAGSPRLDEARVTLREAIRGRYLLVWYADVEVNFLSAIFGGSAARWRRRRRARWRPRGWTRSA